MTPADALKLALEHHQAGRFAPAETLYREVLRQQPANIDALRLLGILVTRTGNPEAGIQLLDRAAALDPNAEIVRIALSEAHSIRGKQFQDHAEFQQSIAHFQRAAELQPRNAQTWNNLGIALQQSGQVAIAAETYRRAISVNPDFADAHSNLSDALRMLGQTENALAAAEHAVRLRPDSAEAFNNLGNALLHLGRHEEALHAYESAVRLNPSFASVHTNLGNAFTVLGRTADALRAYRESVRLSPPTAQTLTNLANALRDADQLEESLAAHRAAVTADPNLPEARVNFGNALRDCGEIEQAIGEYRAAVQSQPNYVPAWSNLLYTLPFSPAMTPAAILSEHRNWGDLVARLLPLLPKAQRVATSGRRLRIGYVSPDLREHPVGRFMLPLLANHDRSAFEIFCYADVARADAVTERLRAHVDTWRNTLTMDDNALAEQIRADCIDILVDLSVHSAGNRLLVFARKPASVQVTYLGYPGTTGLATMDYRITDPFLDPPPESQPKYSERSIHLNTTYWCYGEPELAPDVSPLPAQSNGHVTFGCLNSFAKVSLDALATWAELLAAVPGSRLLIHAGSGPHIQRMRQLFGERVEFIPRLSMDQYFATYQRIDIALDSFPCAGGTTTCDALWMGVPVIALAGDIAVRRSGASLLSLVGLPDLITSDRAGYLAAARALANDVPRLAMLRATLRERMRTSPIMSAPHFARDLERCYSRMWADGS